MSNPESKREFLKDKVVHLVKEFIKTEGGISLIDLELLFGDFNLTEVGFALSSLPLGFLGTD